MRRRQMGTGMPAGLRNPQARERCWIL